MQNENVASTTQVSLFQSSIAIFTEGKFQFLANQFGIDDASGAINNVLGTTFGDVVKSVISSSDLPEFLQDAANTAIDDAVANSRAPSSAEAESATNDELGAILENILKDAAEELKEAAGGSEESRRGGGAAGGGNWLSTLARAMGDVAGRHLENAVKTAGEISQLEDIEGTGDAAQNARANQAREMAGLQAKMQADTQMFKLAQEATTTIVKNVGEALATTARKQ